MNSDRSCGCKSFRTCLICEAEFGLKPREDWGKQLKAENREFYQYSIENGNCFEFDNPKKTLDFPGIKIICDFVTLEEESALISGLDDLPWDSSQSGRRKQNFGPRANFKKRKAKCGPFSGFPSCTKIHPKQVCHRTDAGVLPNCGAMLNRVSPRDWSCHRTAH